MPREDPIVLYNRRWFILLSVALLNGTNAMIWNSFAAIAGMTHQYYDISFAQVNLLSEIFLLLSVPVGLLSMWFIDHIGLRVSLNLAALCNFIGAMLRLVTATTIVPSSSKFILLILGQSVAGLAQPFAMAAPTKIAQNWFPDHQRTIATTAMAMANAFGILLSAIISPLLVLIPDDMPKLHFVYTALASLALVISLLSITRSKPLQPPSNSAAIAPQPFCRELGLILRNKMYMLLAISTGIGIAIVTAITALSAQILCPRGYDDVFSGLAIALMVGLGLLSSVVASILADRTGFLQEIVKISLLMAAFSLAVFVIIMGVPYTPVGVGIILSTLGIFGFGQYPIALELAVETSYPVGEATSSGLMILWGNIGSVVLIIAMQSLGTPTSDIYLTCGADILQGGSASDYSYGVILLASLATVACLVTVICYKCPYRRRAAEVLVRSQNQLDNETMSSQVNLVF